MKNGIFAHCGCLSFFFFLLLGEAGVFIGSMLLTSIPSGKFGKGLCLFLPSSGAVLLVHGKFDESFHSVCSLTGVMSYTRGLQYTFRLSLRNMGLGCT